MTSKKYFTKQRTLPYLMVFRIPQFVVNQRITGILN